MLTIFQEEKLLLIKWVARTTFLKKMLEKYGVWQEKSMYGRKYMGVVRTTVVIDEKGKVVRIFPKVKVDGHVEKVLEVL